MTSLLPPREIQARVRAGETPEELAVAAQTTVEKIMVYAGPVLAERAHVAGLAQAGSVRRSGDQGGSRVLGESVDARLRAVAVDPAGVEWDAWRGLDQRWVVVADLPLDGTTRRATFNYDVSGRSVTSTDDLARWLAGELEERPGLRPAQPTATGPGAGGPGATDQSGTEIPLPPAPAERTLRAVHDGDLSRDDTSLEDAPDVSPGDAPVVSGVDAPTEVPTPEADTQDDDEDGQLALGDDAIALVTGGSAPRPARGPADSWRTETAPPDWLDGVPAPAARTTPPAADTAPEHEDAPAPEPEPPEVAREATGPAPQEALFGDPDAPRPDAPARSGRKRGRATIPSWDEIMFGGPGDGAPLADPDTSRGDDPATSPSTRGAEPDED